MENNDAAVALVPSAPELGRTPIDLLHAAIEKGVDADGIVKLAEVFERMEAKHAEQAFTQALLNFRRDCPLLPKTTVSVHTARYLPLPELAALIDPALLRHELHYSFNTTLENDKMQIECILRHIGGHTTHTFFTAPIDKEAAARMKMTDTHAGGSASSFGKRYALQLALGLVIGLPDDDGGSLIQKISPEQVKILQALLDETKPDIEAFKKYARIERLEDLILRDYGRVEGALLERRRKGKEK